MQEPQLTDQQKVYLNLLFELPWYKKENWEEIIKEWRKEKE